MGLAALRPVNGSSLPGAAPDGAVRAVSGPRASAPFLAHRDLWIDLASKRIDFIEHAIEGGHAGAQWSVVVWTRADGKLSSAKINRDATMVRGVPRVDAEKKHTLHYRDYRELVQGAYGVKKEPDTAVVARR